MKLRTALVAAILATIAVLPGEPALALSTYDSTVMADKPVLFYNRSDAGHLFDLAGGRTASFPNGHGSARSPRGTRALWFNGTTQYAEVSDDSKFSVTQTGVLTVEAWIAPSTLTFPIAKKGYVWWSGKGDQVGNHEWATRMYSSDNTEGRENRISGYVFGPQGGLGAGSYYQKPVQTGQWLHYVFVINTRAKSDKYPMGYTKLYINGQYMMESSIARFPQSISRNGNAKLRIGTRDGASYFRGGVDKYALYNYELPLEAVSRHFQKSW